MWGQASGLLVTLILIGVAAVAFGFFMHRWEKKHPYAWSGREGDDLFWVWLMEEDLEEFE